MAFMPPLLRTGYYPDAQIDALDVSAHPSLRGYWKCNDGGLVVRDYSMYANDLTVELSGVGFDEQTMWSTKPGWMCVKSHDRARIALTPSLTIGDKFIVLSCEIENENVLSDCDMGTAWDSSGMSTGEYRGFAVSTLGDVSGFRVSEYSLGGGASGHPDLIFTDDAITSNNPVGVGSGYGLAGVFRPGVSISTSISGGQLTTSAAAPSVLEAQGDTFALASARNNGFEAQTGYTAVRNYQLWAFDTAPPRLDDTLRWMSQHPGLVPWWWT